MTLMKLCRCGDRIPYHVKHCNDCRGVLETEKQQRVKRYDREVRYSDSNKKYADFYNSKAWRTLSDIVKNNFNGLCVICIVDKEEVTESDTTHHIKELKERWDLRLAESNLVPLCHSCHNKLHVNYSEEDKIYLKNIIKKI